VDLPLTLDGSGTLADRLYRQLTAAIHQRRLVAGDALPPSRDLAAQLGISRSTVTLAYERLTAEGYADARVGSGTFVADGLPTRVPRQRATRLDPTPVAPAPQPAAYDFSLGVPDPALFPLAAWRRHVNRELDTTATIGGRYRDPAGHPGLREGIAHHLGIARSVTTDRDGIVVTAGAQQAIDLLARVLLRPGDIVAVEEPGYPPVRQAFEAHGARIISMPVDDEGADPSNLPAETRIVYVTPSHQFPMGVVMSRARRLQLLAWAAEHDALIVEDDYDSEYRFFDRPLEPMHVLDDAGLVAYVGTFSKALAPGLRTGYVIPPAQLVGALSNARRIADWHGDLVTHAALSRLLESGDFAAHMRRARRAYRARHEAISAELTSGFSEWLRVVPSSAGLHLCAEFRDAVPGTSRRVRDAAAVAGVTVDTLDAYCADAPREGLVLGFGRIGLDQLPDGLRVLQSTLRRVASHPPAVVGVRVQT
jgi:GntR family transcriptional regulator / MocR family aminotransferase